MIIASRTRLVPDDGRKKRKDKNKTKNLITRYCIELYLQYSQEEYWFPMET